MRVSANYMGTGTAEPVPMMAGQETGGRREGDGQETTEQIRGIPVFDELLVVTSPMAIGKAIGAG